MTPNGLQPYSTISYANGPGFNDHFDQVNTAYPGFNNYFDKVMIFYAARVNLF